MPTGDGVEKVVVPYGVTRTDAKDEHVLRRQKLVKLDKLEARRPPFREHLAHTHHMIGFDVIPRAVLHTILEERNSPFGSKSREHLLQYWLWLRYLVVDIREKNPIELTFR